MGSLVVAYVGPQGSSDHGVAKSFCDDFGGGDAIAMSSVAEMLATIDLSAELYGVVAIETSTNGDAISVLDRLIFETTTAQICAERFLDEEVGAFVSSRHTHRDEPSHPEFAVGQIDVLDLCSRPLRDLQLRPRPTLSSTQACQLVEESGDPTLVAVVPTQVAQSFGLRQWPLPGAGARFPSLRSRYVLIGRGIAGPSDRSRTAFVVTPTNDQAGVLESILEKFAKHEINLVSLLSRPVNAVHAFYIACDGHIHDEAIRGALSDLIADGASIKLIGCYPAVENDRPVTAPFDAAPLNSARREAPEAVARLFDSPVVWNRGRA